MEDGISARKAFRTRLMDWIFDEADGSQSARVTFGDFPQTAGVDAAAERLRLADGIAYLEGKGLLRVERSLAGVRSVQLTPYGIDEIERARTRPGQATEHFAPMINIMHVGTMIDSQIQQGSPGATQTGKFSSRERDKIQAFIRSAREAAQHPDLESEDRTKVATELDFMESELSRSEPRPARLKAAAQLVQTIILGGLGGSLGDGITALPWHGIVQGFGM